MKSRLVSLNGLDDQTYQWIRDSGNLLAEVTGAKRVLLFGSLARGGGNRDSDADFCFIVPNGTDLREVGMAAQLAFLHRSRCMDFFYIEESNYLSGKTLMDREIRRSGVTLFSEDSAE